MLAFDPRKRLTVTEALDHPFFDAVSERPSLILLSSVIFIEKTMSQSQLLK